MNVRAVIFCAVLILTAGLCMCAHAEVSPWGELSGDHFVIFFTGDQNFAKDVLEKAEQYYRQIASDLGYPRYSEFWTWDKRVKIFVYPNKRSFLQATKQPEWSEGMADYTTKQITSYAWSQGFVDSLLPHEMAHLIFRDFVGFKGEVPLWLDEGVAQWSEEAKRRIVKDYARSQYEQARLLSVQDMMRIDVRRLPESEKKVHVQLFISKSKDQPDGFIGKNELVNMYYLQAVSMVDFLVTKYGADSFADFCRQLRDGKSMEEALRFSYPTHIRNLADFQSEWRKYIEEE
ncbi:MAG TPA: hypothetical protein PKL77_06630 [Candidatus Omnitrophota bacterium]|nr:hypothetical protein [Candidatus Omnitrophota bacterium]HPT07940.1 hypothetical protein [Candidatus Omnitrophota bacterium]